MSLETFDDHLAWPPRIRRAPAQHSTPPIARSLDLPADAVEKGAWHDDFLILGSRLRPTWDQLEIDEEAPAYVLPYAPGFQVRVTCPVESARAETVRVSCDVIAVPRQVAGFFEFALRENAELPMARLAIHDDRLAVDQELPFLAAGIPALAMTIEAVGWAARRLRPELRAAFPSTTDA